VSRPALSSLLNGKADLSGDALRIEKAFGVKMDTLMRMQSNYDIAKTSSREKEIRVREFHRTAGIHPWQFLKWVSIDPLTIRVFRLCASASLVVCIEGNERAFELCRREEEAARRITAPVAAGAHQP
jgi:hypothetical protein